MESAGYGETGHFDSAVGTAFLRLRRGMSLVRVLIYYSNTACSQTIDECNGHMPFCSIITIRNKTRNRVGFLYDDTASNVLTPPPCISMTGP